MAALNVYKDFMRGSLIQNNVLAGLECTKFSHSFH